MHTLLTALLLTACDDTEAPPEAVEPPAEVVEAPSGEPGDSETPAEAEPAATAGRLLVQGSSGAVFIDGEAVGHLPMADPIEIEAGEHELKVLDMKTGRGQELTIHIEAGQLMEIPPAQ